jgi:hypothetical protein
MVALTCGVWSWREPGLSPRLPSFLTLSIEVSFLSALVACPGSGALLGGELPECSDKVLVFFILISLFSEVPVVRHRGGKLHHLVQRSFLFGYHLLEFSMDVRCQLSQNLSLRRTSPTCDSGFTVVYF